MRSTKHTSGWKASHETGELCLAGLNKPRLRSATISARSPQGARQSTAPLTRSTCEVLAARPCRGSRNRGGELNPGSPEGKTPASARPSRGGSPREVPATVLTKLLLRLRPGHSPNSTGRKEKMCTPDPSVSRTQINNPPGERHLLPLLPAQATTSPGESCPGTRNTMEKMLTAQAL